MPYTPQTWNNGSGGATPLSATRLNYMEDGIANAGGGGGGTLYVCASDALNPTGDYICDGTADEVQINAAITALATKGGSVVLSEGTFNLAAPVLMNSKGVTLSGQGLGTNNDVKGSVLKGPTSGSFNLVELRNNYTTLSNLLVWGQAGWTGDCVEQILGQEAFDTVISRCNFINLGTGDALRLAGSGSTWVSHCYLEANSATGSSVWVRSYVTVESCYLYSGSYWAVYIEGSQPSDPEGATDSVIVSNCHVDGDGAGFVTSVGGNSRVSIVGNIALFDWGTDAQILLNDCHQAVVEGNNLGWNDGAGIKLIGCDESMVTGNIVRRTGSHGIWLVDCNDCSVTGNLVANSGTLTDDTYSGIILDGDTNNCSVLNNTVRRDLDSSLGNQPRYGIRIDDSTCDANFVTCNDLLNSSKSGGAGGAYSDAGTGTVTTAANRT